jgi:hypothetical protein
MPQFSNLKHAPGPLIAVAWNLDFAVLLPGVKLGRIQELQEFRSCRMRTSGIGKSLAARIRIHSVLNSATPMAVGPKTRRRPQLAPPAWITQNASAFFTSLYLGYGG